MAHQSDLIARDIGAYLHQQQHKSLLRFLTCGSVDDGKSTLIGRLLFESRLVFADQLEALVADSKKSGTQGEEIDLALLVDGLAAEREQGITIDVAYRFFSTDKRKFIVADTPGHEQYTRNMVTAASTADLAIILIDARKGVLVQTRRHSLIVSLLGIRKVVLAVNKMDAVGYDQNVFDAIVADYGRFAARLRSDLEIVPIPLSALKGDNVIEASTKMPWYAGRTLLAHLEAVPVEDEQDRRPFRMPVQWVNRPSADFRGFAGYVSGGVIKKGDLVRALPSGHESRVARIVTHGGDLESAVAGQSVTLTLEDEIDVSRGDLLVDVASAPSPADQLQATLIWMHENPLLPGRSYLLKTGARTVTATITSLRHKLDINTGDELAAQTLAMNDIGVGNVALDRKIGFDSYEGNRETGSFILIDRQTNATVGAGLVHFPLQRADNVHWHALDVSKKARAEAKGQKASILWFTGLSGAGKSTIANLVEKRLHAFGHHTYLLDGDNVRHGLNKDLGFTDADRVENVRRVAEVAKLMADAGLIVLVSFISPFRAEREFARSIVEAGEFFEVFVDVALEEAERRDPKGLYKKARAGTLRNMTGIDSPYEAPEKPEIRIASGQTSPDEAAAQIVDALRAAGRLR